MVTILSGTLYLGLGDRFDETKLHAFTPGTFLTEMQNMNHFAMTKGEEVILQLDAIGPSGMTYVNPADDPAKK